MAGRYAVERECAKLNQMRRVQETNQYSLERFWRLAQGSFLISGGTVDSRAMALCEKLCCEMGRKNIPTFVLTASCGALEREMIRRLDGGVGGKMIVSSPRYRNYDFFSDWSAANIVSYFVSASRILGCTQEEMPQYIREFIKVLAKCYQPSLSSITKLAGYSDENIQRIGCRQGVPSLVTDTIHRLSNAGKMFRLVVEQIADAFSSLTTPECTTSYNLSSGRVGRGVYLVELASNRPDLLYEYFSVELRRVLARSGIVRVVLSDMHFLSPDDPLLQAFWYAQSKNVETGVSTQDAALMLGEKNASLPVRLILLDRALSDGNLETILKPMGTYTHYEPVYTGHKPAKLFPLLSDTSWTPVPEPGRLRVRPQDTVGYEAVFNGVPGGEILLARHVY